MTDRRCKGLTGCTQDLCGPSRVFDDRTASSRTEGNFRCRLTENHKNRRDGYDMPPEDIMWNKISKSRQQDIIVITCGLLLILLAKVLA